MDKPKCYGAYAVSFPKQGRTCRACPFAVECKSTLVQKAEPRKEKKPSGQKELIK